MNSRPVLELEGVGYTYNVGRRNENTIFLGLDLEVWPGEIIGIVGASGSGKTTLLGVASLLMRPTVGDVWFAGRRQSKLGDSRLTRLRARISGLITQTGDLDPHLTALENVVSMPRLLGKRISKAEGRNLLESVGLVDARIHRSLPSELSGGERQRVAVARALACRPEIIFADEPTSALDYKNKELVMQTLTSAKPANTAMLIVSHDVAVMRHWCTRVIQMHDGVLQSEEVNRSRVSV